MIIEVLLFTSCLVLATVMSYYTRSAKKSAEEENTEFDLASMRNALTKLMADANKTERWRVQGTLKGSLDVRGYRRRVYEYASVNAGMYTSDNRSDSIGYVGKDLVVDIAFFTAGDAGKFVGYIEQLYPDDIVAELEMMRDDTFVFHPSSCIRLHHYVATDFDSPPATFSQVSSVYSVVLASSAYARCQSIEEYHPKFQKCHMYGRKEPEDPGKPNHVSNPNNKICLTPTAHAGYDSVPSECAFFAIKALKTYDEPTVFEIKGKMETRYRVDVAVEFVSLEASGYFRGIMFKEGFIAVSPTEIHSFVHVLNPAQFVDFMMWKYKNTKDQWP